MVPRRFLAWTLLALLAGATLGACGKSDDPTSPLLDTDTGGDPPPAQGVESTTPVPATLAASRVFEAAGDPTCCSVPDGPYGTFGFRLASVSSGFHPLTTDGGSGSCNSPPQDAENGITLTVDGSTLSWTATMPVGAVIVGSAVGARVYVYAPTSWGDTGLRAKLDPDTQLPAAVTSVEICYDYALRVQTAVLPTWTRTVHWGLQQSVTPDRWDLFPGDGAVSRVTVAVAPTQTVDQPPTVHGTVTVTNPTPLPATISSFSNVISVGILAPLDCAIATPYVLQPGQSLVCSYEYALPDTRPRTNSVFMRTTSVVRGGTGVAAITFGPQTVENGSVQVQGTGGRTWGPFTAAATFAYDRRVDVELLDGVAEGVLDESVSIPGTNVSATGSITVRAWTPTLTQQLATSFQRTWQWSLERELELQELILSEGQSFVVGGHLRASAVPGPGTDHRVAGRFTLHNPHPSRALGVAQLRAWLALETGTALDCGDAFEVPPEGTVSCELSLALPDGAPRTSRVSANYQNQNFAFDGTATAAGQTPLEDATALAFEAPTLELDRCAEVLDLVAGIATTVCAQGATTSLPAPLAIGPYAACGVYDVAGTAELVGADTGWRAQVPYGVMAEVPCARECTRGATYWQNHSMHGPGAFDAAWSSFPAGADTPFFGGRFTYMDVLLAAGQGDQWLWLAGNWVAAQLNQLAGADLAEVEIAFSEAEALLRATEPGTLSEDLQWRAEKLGRLLEAYNAGEIGPGNCELAP